MFSQVMDLSSSSAASVGSEHISNEMLHSYLCGAGPAPETPSLQLLAYSATADSLGVAQRVPSQRKRFGDFTRVGICSHLLQTRALLRTASKLPTAASAPSNPADTLWRGALQRLTLPRLLPAWLPGVGKDTETQGSLTESAPMAEAPWQ